MSCYGCVTKFSFFTKEHSCSNCKFSFCSKCLKQKAIIEKEEKSVCKNCFKKLTAKPSDMTSADIDTPDLLKRLETLENPAKPPITIIRHSNRLANLKNGLSSEDKKILERLEKLKADHTRRNLPDESEIKRRLALLQGRSLDSTAEKPQSFVVPPKSQEEQVKDLLNQYMEESSMQADLEVTGVKNVAEIENRLKKLQTSDSTQMAVDSTKQEGGVDDDDDDDDEAATLQIIKKAIAEGQLQRKLKESQGKDDDSEISDMDDNEPEEECPWCIICNEDATLKCFGCDGSLYCNTCFKQGHEYFDMEDHKTIPYTKKETLSEEEM